MPVSSGLKGLLKNSKETELSIYGKWKETKKKTNGYILIANELEEYLKNLKKPSLNLYIFYAIHSNNQTGESFYSLEQISKVLGVSIKTISNWNKELEEVGLIKRKQQYNKSARTFLQPTSDFIYCPKNERQKDKLISDLSDENYIYKDCYELQNSKETYFLEKYATTYKDIARNIYVLYKKEDIEEKEDYWYETSNSIGFNIKELNFNLNSKENYIHFFEIVDTIFKNSDSIETAKTFFEKV